VFDLNSPHPDNEMQLLDDFPELNEGDRRGIMEMNLRNNMQQHAH
jgi:hypothetical protein